MILRTFKFRNLYDNFPNLYVMKKNVFILLMIFTLFSSTRLISQENNEADSLFSADSTLKPERVFGNVYLVMAYQNWTNMPENAQIKNGSTRVFSIYVVNNFLKNKKHFNFASGISVSFHNLQTNVKSWLFDSSGNIIKTGIYPDSINYKKNKTVITYLSVPVELKFKLGFNPKKAINLGIGFRAGLLLDGHNKIVYANQKIKDRISENLNHINYGLYGYIGYKYFNLFGEYSLSSTFDAVDKIKPWSVGIGLIF